VGVVEAGASGVAVGGTGVAADDDEATRLFALSQRFAVSHFSPALQSASLLHSLETIS
jgi:hypothetical protein